MHILVNANNPFPLFSFQNNDFEEYGKQFTLKVHIQKNESDSKILSLRKNKVLHFYTVLVILPFNIFFSLPPEDTEFLVQRP